MNKDAPDALRYVRYDSARENEYVAAMRQLISKDLSEPYSIYVYRYFLYQWGDLCFLAMDKDDTMVGVVVSKLETHRGGPMRGYIAMLAVREEYRGRGIATELVRMAIDAMIARNADEVGVFASFFSPGNGSSVFWDACVLTCVSDCPRNRNHKHRRYETVRAPRVPPQQASAPILSERQLRLPAGALSQGRGGLDSHAI